MTDNASYWGVLPSNVRYADISAGCKVFYAEITSLQNVKGYCFANNAYFEKLYGVSQQTVSGWITELRKANFIDVSCDKGQRKISTTNKLVGGVQKKECDHTKKLVAYIGINKKNNNKKERDVSFNQKKEFETIWKEYPNRIGKKQAYRHFVKSVNSDIDFLHINVALKAYKASEVVKKGFVQNGSTWFNNWEDWKDVKVQKTITRAETGKEVLNKMEEYKQEAGRSKEVEDMINKLLKKGE